MALNAQWSTDEDATTRLEFGLDSPDEHTLPVSTQPRTVHAGTMLDLPPDTEVMWRAVTDYDGTEQVCEGTTRTGILPSWLPDFSLEDDSDVVDPDTPYLVGVILDLSFDNAVMFIVNRAAEYVWYQAVSPGDTVLQVQMALDEPGHLVYGDFDAAREVDRGEARRISLTGEEDTDPAALSNGHHFFFQHEDGTIAYTAVDIREWYDEEEDEIVSVAGDALVEVAPDGTTRTLYSTWDWLEVVKSSYWDVSIYSGSKDWTHANAVDYNPETDSYIVSLANVGLVVEIDRSTGEQLRMFHGDGDPVEGAWRVSDVKSGFVHQHDVNWTDDGTLLMVSSDPWTHIVEYELDEDAQELHEIWSYGKDNNEILYILGNARRLPGGNTLYGGSVLSFVREVTPAGETAWQMQGPTDLRFGNVVPMPQLPNGQD